MSMVKKAALGAVAGGSLLFTAGLGLAGAQPADAGDGQVDVNLGNITTIEDLEAGAAVEVAGLVCSDPVTSTTLDEVARGTTPEATCTSAQGNQVITFTQNTAGEVGTAPAQLAPAQDDAVAPVGPGESPEVDDDTVNQPS